MLRWICRDSHTCNYMYVHVHACNHVYTSSLSHVLIPLRTTHNTSLIPRPFLIALFLNQSRGKKARVSEKGCEGIKAWARGLSNITLQATPNGILEHSTKKITLRTCIHIHCSAITDPQGTIHIGNPFINMLQLVPRCTYMYPCTYMYM